MSKQNSDMMRVYILGKEYLVPSGLTIMKAIEYSGMRLTHGCGCRGGICGACVTIYRMEEDTKWKFCLACQTDAQDGMHLVQLPYTPNYRAKYDINTTELSQETLLKLYPTIKRCMGCNTCTNSCPLNLSVLDYVSALLVGDWETAKELSIECLLCGMCAARCPANLTPMNMAMMVRRLMGREAHQKAANPTFKKRLSDIKAGKFDEEISSYMTMEKPEMQKIYKEFQATKGASV